MAVAGAIGIRTDAADGEQNEAKGAGDEMVHRAIGRRAFLGHFEINGGATAIALGPTQRLDREPAVRRGVRPDSSTTASFELVHCSPPNAISPCTAANDTHNRRV
jgi:hypothetical protein